MNIFYGVIILNLQELAQGKEDTEGSQEAKSEIKLEKELQNIRMELQHKATGKKARETIVVVEVCEMSIQNMVETEKEDEPTQQQEPSGSSIKDIMNICLTILITVNLALEFEGQSSNFAFITDAVDCGLFLCCFCVLTFTIVTEIKY